MSTSWRPAPVLSSSSGRFCRVHRAPLQAALHKGPRKLGQRSKLHLKTRLGFRAPSVRQTLLNPTMGPSDPVVPPSVHGAGETGLFASAADQGSSYLCPGLPVRPLAQGPNWPPANCFNVAISAPNLHLKAGPTTEQAERFATRRTPLNANATGVAERVCPHTVATRTSSGRHGCTCQVSGAQRSVLSSCFPSFSLWPTARGAGRGGSACDLSRRSGADRR